MEMELRDIQIGNAAYNIFYWLIYMSKHNAYKKQYVQGKINHSMNI